jgi:hypothetical protein
MSKPEGPKVSGRTEMEEDQTCRNVGGSVDPRPSQPAEVCARISGRLIDLFLDELDEDTDLHTARVWMDMARIAWNMTVEPEEGEDERQRMLNHLPFHAREDADAILGDLRARKLELFPGDLRLVVSTAVDARSDGSFYFTAAALGFEDGSGRGRTAEP